MNKSYRIGQQEGEVLNGHLSHRGVEGGKQFVLRKDIAFAKQGHESRLAHVGVPHQGYTHQFTPVLR